MLRLIEEGHESITDLDVISKRDLNDLFFDNDMMEF